MNCLKCNTNLDPDLVELGWKWHAGCWPDHEPMPETGQTIHDMMLKEDLIEIVQWADRNSTRSQQVSLGCSEVGHGCLRRIGMRMAGIKQINFPDGWPAIVGTSIHAWMERAVNDFQTAHGVSEWLTEVLVIPNKLVTGHTDLYREPTVLDWKFPGRTNMQKMRKEGISELYEVQIQLYGLGHVLAGRKVERVGIVALGREGWLKDMFVKTMPFDRQLAGSALKRVYDLGAQLIEMDIENNPTKWRDVPSDPSRLCGYCPFYRPGKPADDTGCPGKYSGDSTEEFFA